MNNADRPASPLDSFLIGLGEAKQEAAGLTKREHAAIQIMAGIASDPSATGSIESIARCAVEWADALFAQLEKSK